MTFLSSLFTLAEVEEGVGRRERRAISKYGRATTARLLILTWRIRALEEATAQCPLATTLHSQNEAKTVKNMRISIDIGVLEVLRTFAKSNGVSLRQTLKS